LLALAAILLTVYLYGNDRAAKTANIDYWSFGFPVSVRLPSGEMSIPTANTRLLSVRNNGPATAEGVMISVQAGEAIKCTEFGAGLGLAETINPTKVTAEPFLCQYYYDHFYPRYQLFFLVDPSSTMSYLAIDVTGSNAKVTDISSWFESENK